MTSSPTAGSPGPPRRSAEIEALFGHSTLTGEVRAFELWGSGDPNVVREEEVEVVATAVEGRRTQFAAGRQCAHAAMRLLSALDSQRAEQPILPDVRRAPRWPPGVVGSISHTDGYASAAVAPAIGASGWPTLGIDAEQVGRVTGELHERLFLPHERAWLAALETADAEIAATLMFGAKEAFYKAQYPVTGAWVGFHDLELRPDPADPHRFTLHPATELDVLEPFAWPLIARGTVRRGIALTAVVAVRV